MTTTMQAVRSNTAPSLLDAPDFQLRLAGGLRAHQPVLIFTGETAEALLRPGNTPASTAVLGSVGMRPHRAGFGGACAMVLSGDPLYGILRLAHMGSSECRTGLIRSLSWEASTGTLVVHPSPRNWSETERPEQMFNGGIIFDANRLAQIVGLGDERFLELSGEAAAATLEFLMGRSAEDASNQVSEHEQMLVRALIAGTPGILQLLRGQGSRPKAYSREQVAAKLASELIPGDRGLDLAHTVPEGISWIGDTTYLREGSKVTLRTAEVSRISTLVSCWI